MFAHTVFRRVLLSMTCVLAAAPATAQDVRVNVGLGGAEPDGPNGSGVLSGDGRFVASLTLPAPSSTTTSKRGARSS